MPAYRMKCRHPKCGKDHHRFYKVEEYDLLAYGGREPGIACYDCGYPRMVVIKSKKSVDDTFKPGFQRNIRKHCDTYAQYKKHLKDMGLVEMGYEDFPQQKEGQPFWSDAKLERICKEHGVKLSGNEIKHLKEWVPEGDNA